MCVQAAGLASEKKEREAFSLFVANAKYYTELVAQPPQHLIGPCPRTCDGSTLPYPSKPQALLDSSFGVVVVAVRTWLIP
jgi:hypothetical protein